MKKRDLLDSNSIEIEIIHKVLNPHILQKGFEIFQKMYRLLLVTFHLFFIKPIKQGFEHIITWQVNIIITNKPVYF